MIWAAGGLLVCFTLLGIPIGLVMILISGLPLAIVLRRYYNKVIEWQNREHPMDNDEEVPWIQ